MLRLPLTSIANELHQCERLLQMSASSLKTQIESLLADGRRCDHRSCDLLFLAQRRTTMSRARKQMRFPPIRVNLLSDGRHLSYLDGISTDQVHLPPSRCARQGTRRCDQLEKKGSIAWCPTERERAALHSQEKSRCYERTLRVMNVDPSGYNPPAWLGDACETVYFGCLEKNGYKDADCSNHGDRRPCSRFGSEHGDNTGMRQRERESTWTSARR